MNPITHFLTSWVVADLSGKLKKKDLLLITVAGISPDVDGLGAIVEILTRNSSNPLLWWSEYHHSLHTLLFSLIITLLVYFLSTNKLLSALLSFLAIHIHFFCDIVGSRGPDGYQWPIFYFKPFSESFQIVWSGQWALNSWQNILITIILIAIVFFLAIKRGYSPLFFISEKYDKLFVETLKKRFKKCG